MHLFFFFYLSYTLRAYYKIIKNIIIRFALDVKDYKLIKSNLKSSLQDY